MNPSPRRPIDQSITFTYTDDLAVASHFFRDVMELEFVLDQGACHIFRLSETSYIGVCDLPDRPRAQAGVTITIVSSDVDGWHRFLGAKGVRFVQTPRFSERFKVYSSLFLSPNGYRIEIQSFEDPKWSETALP